MGVASANAFVACCDAKYAYDCCRPVTAIREERDKHWSPYLDTPPFPAYPSGHSTLSAAAACVLVYLFPEGGLEFARMSMEAANSRLFGGIHTRADNEVGAQIGQLVALRASTRDPADAARGRGPAR